MYKCSRYWVRGRLMALDKESKEFRKEKRRLSLEDGGLSIIARL
jgi:hypothetical protein